MTDLIHLTTTEALQKKLAEWKLDYVLNFGRMLTPTTVQEMWCEDVKNVNIRRVNFLPLSAFLTLDVMFWLRVAGPMGKQVRV